MARRLPREDKEHVVPRDVARSKFPAPEPRPRLRLRDFPALRARAEAFYGDAHAALLREYNASAL